MSQTPIELKGSSFTLSVVHLHDSQPEVIYQALQEKIEQAPAFLKNAPVVINVAALTAETDWIKLQQAISSTGLHVVGVSGCTDDALKKIIAQAGLPLLSEGKAQRRVIEPVAAVPAAVKTKVINTPVRSGQQIYARNCDLIVTSSVSAGAEVIADGNIHIYGMMRGRALAGVSGDVQSQIFCTHLAAELVSIAGRYWLSDQIPEAYFGQPARINLNQLDNVLTIKPLD
ncbi:septum site-determining protein MinC [Pectobacterium versatile]|jgi:septum site-determining protein MinC|uniref:Probable septum site-determining protein MinC n=1 Tax=Pectobacterium versatile TaxID=2488639 RepID=A0A855MHC6_9GAMM|nr:MULTISPECIES: septum site-determining protein MinC [Pectobacterium]MBA0157536.1 septum site-determining protein MinC [Pectobacterium versatile]MBA0171292.1 septum site-determining protein MinC [Pectobacterium versatile]MBQ4790728.1 septum site-determining protein MinC [Pectobacterium versatile]MCA6916507.1 septum site-determining protein MinC [Pectobacterium versatile]MCA6936433.1 septum site-determining protein MinC [Pectobacterium versatile]